MMFNVQFIVHVAIIAKPTTFIFIEAKNYVLFMKREKDAVRLLF